MARSSAVCAKGTPPTAALALVATTAANSLSTSRCTAGSIIGMAAISRQISSSWTLSKLFITSAAASGPTVIRSAATFWTFENSAYAVAMTSLG